MADIIDIDVFQTVTSVSFEVEPNTNIININKVTSSGGGGITNLTTSQTSTNFTINSDTGTDASVPLGNGTLAGATLNDYTTAEKTKLSNISGTNTGDQNLQSVTNIGATTNKTITINPTVSANGLNINTTWINGEPISKGINIISEGENTGIYINNSINGKAIYALGNYNETTAYINGGDTGITLTNIGSTGIYIEGGSSESIFTSNASGDAGLRMYQNYGDAILLNLGSTSNGITINSGLSSVGYPIVINKNGVDKLLVNQAGELTATKLIKSGGTASQILAADGSVITAGTNITISGGQISSVGGTGGGGSSVNYYLNGGTSQGTFVGTTYYEFSKTAIIGTGADFNISSNGYIASFITDVSDPSLLLIPAGNWNLEFFFSASSAGGSPSFYVELYKYDGTTFTSIASSSANPEGITGGTAIDAYFTPLAVPETILTVNDRLAIRVFVNASSKTITLHTQNGHLCEVITTFTAGLTALNGLQAQVQNFATGTTGTDFAINSSGSTHTFNLPSASATARGVVTTASQTFAGDKTFTGTIGASNLSNTNTGDNATNTQYSGLATSKQDVITLTTTGTSGASTLIGATLNIPQYSGATNLGYTAAPTNGTVTSSTGTSATLPLADATNAGLLKPAKFTVLENTSGTNTGDQNLSGYALLASPTFTGTPSLPTGTTGTTQTPLNNSTRLATTAYVEAACAVVASSGGVSVSSQDTFGTANIATVTSAQYAAFVSAGTVSATTLYFITA